MANPVQIITTPNQPDPIPGNHDGLKTLQTPMAPQKTISTALFQSKYHVTTLHCMMVRLTTAQINALTHVGRQCCDPRQAHKKRLTTGLRNVTQEMVDRHPQYQLRGHEVVSRLRAHW